MLSHFCWLMEWHLERYDDWDDIYAVWACSWRGVVGITLKPETLKVWALSLHACSRLEYDLDDVTDEDTQSKVVTKHKDEAKAGIVEYKRDREEIRQKLDTCINPLDSSAHPSGVVNVVSGQIGSTEVNVHNAVTIGTEQIKVFESRLPQGLYETITKKVVTMDHARKHVKVGAVKVFDTNLIYSRVIGLHARGWAIDINDVLGSWTCPNSNVHVWWYWRYEDCEIEICLEENYPSWGVW